MWLAPFIHLRRLISMCSFHFDTAAGGGLVQPCEAAFLSAPNPKLPANDITLPAVTVLVVSVTLITVPRCLIIFLDQHTCRP